MDKNDTKQCLTSHYIGVRKRKYGRWVSEIREPGKNNRIWLGSFDTAEMAAAAYDVATLHLKGSKARFNFPDLAGQLPSPASANAGDIRRAAHQAAMQLSGDAGQQAGGLRGGPGLERVELSPSEIQAINESPLDSPKMWMELGGGSSTYGGVNEIEWDENDSYSIWD